jgi:hypothetical protein
MNTLINTDNRRAVQFIASSPYSIITDPKFLAVILFFQPGQIYFQCFDLFILMIYEKKLPLI